MFINFSNIFIFSYILFKLIPSHPYVLFQSHAKSLENKKSCVTDTNLQHLFVKMTLG